MTITVSLPDLGLIFVAGILTGFFILWLLSRGTGNNPPNEATTINVTRHHLVSLDAQHEVHLTFPTLPKIPYWKLCNRAIAGEPLDYRSVAQECDLGSEDFRKVRDELKRRFPEAFGKKDVLTPTTPLIEFFKAERDCLRTEQNRTIKNLSGGPIPAQMRIIEHDTN